MNGGGREEEAGDSNEGQWEGKSRSEEAILTTAVQVAKDPFRILRVSAFGIRVRAFEQEDDRPGAAVREISSAELSQ